MEIKDLFEKTKTAAEVRDIETLQSLAAYPFCKVCTPNTSLSPVEVRMGDRSVLMFGSNDYLALSRDARVIEASVQATQQYGSGCSGSRLLNGTTSLHLQLEEELAQYFEKEAALLFGTGFQTNTAVVGALAGIKDVVVADEYCHTSLVEGMRLSYARKARFRHNCPESLADILSKCEATEGRLVLVEGVYSMSGVVAKLPDIVEVCRQYKARLYLDDAHGIGVLGPCGRGVAEHFGLEREVDVINGTFSKSFASAGGFVAAEKSVIEYVKHFAAPFVFSASMPPASLAAVRAALQIIKNEPERRTWLLERAAECRALLAKERIETPDWKTPIIVLRAAEIDDPRVAALKIGLLCNALVEEGYYVNGIVGNAVPFPLLRISITAAHSSLHVSGLVRSIVKASKQVGIRLKGLLGV